jgi:hypothetical protein
MLKIEQEVPTAFLELLLEVLDILAGLIAKGPRDLLVGEQGLAGIGGVKRPKQ